MEHILTTYVITRLDEVCNNLDFDYLIYLDNLNVYCSDDGILALGCLLSF